MVRTILIEFRLETTFQSLIYLERVVCSQSFKNTNTWVINITSKLPKSTMKHTLFIKIVHYDHHLVWVYLWNNDRKSEPHLHLKPAFENSCPRPPFWRKYDIRSRVLSKFYTNIKLIWIRLVKIRIYTFFCTRWQNMKFECDGIIPPQNDLSCTPKRESCQFPRCEFTTISLADGRRRRVNKDGQIIWSIQDNNHKPSFACILSRSSLFWQSWRIFFTLCHFLSS